MVQRLLIALLLLPSAFCLAQASLIEGRVVDSQSEAGLPGAHILIKGSFMGATADEEGNFRLEVPQLPVELVVTEVAHRSRIITVNRSALVIALDPLQIELYDVTVTAEYEPYSILTNQVSDFEFYDELILVLGSSGMEMRVIDQRGKLIRRSRTPARAIELFKDCLGNIHLLTADSAYQIFYDYEFLHFLDPFPIAAFNRQLRYCRGEWAGGLVYQFSSRRGLIQTLVLARDGQQYELQTLADSNGLNYLSREYDLDYFLQQRRRGDGRYLHSLAILEDSLEKFQDEVELDWFDRHLIRPRRIGTVVKGEILKVYDLREMRSYSHLRPGEEASQEILDLSARHAEAVLIDEVNGQAYLLYRKRAETRLLPLEGQAPPISLAEKPFPTAVKLYNGLSYFISNPELDGGYYLFRKNPALREGD